MVTGQAFEARWDRSQIEDKLATCPRLRRPAMRTSLMPADVLKASGAMSMR